MKEYEIEFHFHYRSDEKDFDVETIQAESFDSAVQKLKAMHEGRIWIFKTIMKSEKEIQFTFEEILEMAKAKAKQQGLTIDFLIEKI